MVIDGYVRVSQVRGRAGERFISPLEQRAQIEGWARLHGALVGEVFEELDESGARADRPLLERALARVEAGTSQGLVVARLDRFGRSLIDGLAAIERIQRAGGTFVSVSDGFDLRTETGRLIMRIMLAMGEWQLDRIRSSWDSARARAVKRGVHCSPKPPTGYRRGPSGRLVVHPEDGAMIGELFAARAQGEPIMELCRQLQTRGVLTPYGNPVWNPTSVRRMLGNRVYLGEARSGDFVRVGAHPPLTDPVTWQLAQQPREMTARSPATASLLGGLVRCAGCSLAMSAVTARLPDGRTRRYYQCARRCSGGTCEAPASIAGSLIEPLVEDVFFAALARRRPRPDGKGVRVAEQAVQRAEAALERYRDNDRAAVSLGPDRYADGLAKRAAPRARAARARRRARPQRPRRRSRPAGELEQRWPDMSVRERRAALAELIECVFVTRGRRHPAERTLICLRGEGPAELPRRGCKGAVPQPFSSERCSGPPLRPSAVARRPWSERRLRAELERFLDGRAAWPPWEPSTPPAAPACTSRSCSRAARACGRGGSASNIPVDPTAQAPLDRSAHPRDARALPGGQNAVAERRRVRGRRLRAVARRARARGRRRALGGRVRAGDRPPPPGQRVLLDRGATRGRAAAVRRRTRRVPHLRGVPSRRSRRAADRAAPAWGA